MAALSSLHVRQRGERFSWQGNSIVSRYKKLIFSCNTNSAFFTIFCLPDTNSQPMLLQDNLSPAFTLNFCPLYHLRPARKTRLIRKIGKYCPGFQSMNASKKFFGGRAHDGMAESEMVRNWASALVGMHPLQPRVS
jgi:hypothetical protein